MDATQTLAELRRLGVDVRYDNQRDQLRAQPLSLVDESLAAAIREHKAELGEISRRERGAFANEAEVFDAFRERRREVI